MQTALFDHLDTSYAISGVMHYNATYSSQEDWMFTQCFQLCLYISLCMHLYNIKKKYSFFGTYSTSLSCVSANIIVSEPPFFWNNPLQAEPHRRHGLMPLTGFTIDATNSIVLHNESQTSEACSTQELDLASTANYSSGRVRQARLSFLQQNVIIFCVIL